jgi:hypothetical protein
MGDKERHEYLQFTAGILERQLERQRCNYDSIDTKGSILVGASAILLQLSLTVPKDHSCVFPASILFGAAAVLGVYGIRFRRWETTPDPKNFIECLKGASMDDALSALIDSIAEVHERNEEIIRDKARVLAAGFWLVAAGTVWACLSMLTAVLPRALEGLLHQAVWLIKGLT